MKNLYMATLLAGLGLAACSEDVLMEGSDVNGSLSIKDAAIEVNFNAGDKDSRAAVGADGRVAWLPTDQLTVFIRKQNQEVAGSWQDQKLVHTFNYVKDQGVNRFVHSDQCACGGTFTFEPQVAYDWYVVHQGDQCASAHAVQVNRLKSPMAINTAKDEAAKTVVSPMTGCLEGVIYSGNKMNVPSITLHNEFTLMTLHVANGGADTLTVQSVKVEAPEGTLLWGDADFDLITHKCNFKHASGKDSTANAAVFVADLVGDSLKLAAKTQHDVCFTLLPFTLQRGDSLRFSIDYMNAKNEKQTFVATKSFPQDYRFAGGMLNSTTFTIGKKIASGDDPIHFTNVAFKNYLVHQTHLYSDIPFDENGDGEISFNEAAKIEQLNISFWNQDEFTQALTSLQGIEYLTNLGELDVGGSQTKSLKELDVSKNVKLEYLGVYGHKELTTVDVSQLTNLNDLYLNENNLSALDVTKNTKLSSFNCGNNPNLSQLDVTKNTELLEFNCSYCNLSALDVANNPLLIGLNCIGNKNLTMLNVANNTYLRSFQCSDCGLSSLDVSKNIGLQQLECGINKNITSIDVSMLPKLIHLNVSSCDLSSINVRQNPLLKRLYINSNKQITSVDVSQNKDLEILNLYSMRLDSLDVSSNEKLQYLDLSYTRVKQLNVSNNKLLSNLRISKTKIESIDLSANTKLTSFEAKMGVLKQVDFSANPELQSVNLSWSSGLSPVLEFPVQKKLAHVHVVETPITEIWLLPRNDTDYSFVQKDDDAVLKFYQPAQ